MIRKEAADLLRNHNQHIEFSERGSHIMSSQLLRHGIVNMLQSAGTGSYRLVAPGSARSERLPNRPAPLVWPAEEHRYFELAYVTSGECAMVIEGVPYHLHTGHFCLIDPHRIHYVAGTRPAKSYRLIWFGILPPFVDIHLAEYNDTTATTQFIARTRVPLEEWVLGMLGDLVEEARRRTSFSTVVEHGYLTSFLKRVSSRLPQLPLSKEAAAEPTTTQMVEQAILFIKEHCGNPQLGVPEIARQVGLSPNYFSECFREVEGIAPYRYLLNTRMARAADLLCRTPWTIERISCEVGFVSSSHFSRTFKQHFDKSPTDFRGSTKN